MGDSGIAGGCQISWCDGWIDRISRENGGLLICGEFMLECDHPEYRPRPDGFGACYRKGSILVAGASDPQFSHFFGKSRGGWRQTDETLPLAWDEDVAPSLSGAKFSEGLFLMEFDLNRMQCSAGAVELTLVPTESP